MIDLIKWFALLEILGWLIFPLAFKVFRASVDKGYSICKVFGLLVWGYIYWLGNSFQIIENNFSGVLFACLILIIVSVVFIRNISLNILVKWCKENLIIIIFFDALFLLAFTGWAIVRAGNPEIVGTEKPMELAFITSIFRSPSFPPADPWLSDYAISYYYFGYLLVTMLMRVCGTISGVAFNLTISAWFALVAVSSSGILFNLLHFRKQSPDNRGNLKRLLFMSLLAPFMILIISNGEGLLEIIHSKGIFWQTNSNGQMISTFWKWLDIKELTEPPPLPLDWIPGRSGGTWWWRASRVLQDYTLNGQSREIIDEFPFFSYYLADIHPHVLSMPFVILAIYLGFSLFIQQVNSQLVDTNFPLFLRNPQIWLTSFILGGLLFINTWDFPIYYGFFVLIFFIQIIKVIGLSIRALKPFIFYSITLGILSILLYIPFLIGLSSQAGGLIPSLIFRTRGIHFLVMFFSQLILIFWFLIMKNKEVLIDRAFYCYLIIGIISACLIVFFSILYALIPVIGVRFLGFLGKLLDSDMSLRQYNLNSASSSLLATFGTDNFRNLILESVVRLIKEPFIIFFLISMLIICIFGLLRLKPVIMESTSNGKNEEPIQYVKLIIVLGILLCLIPEFFYLRDQFGWRMNTIFKFYFQAWIVFSLAAAFAITEIIQQSRTNLIKMIYGLAISLVLIPGLIYPIFALRERINASANFEWSLDGNKYYKIFNPLEHEAITFLNSVSYGTIVESVGGSYSNYGRISKFTGLPSVLGWPGHESQWRGGTEEIGNREMDVKDLYITSNWDQAEIILDKYKICYVFVGLLEKNSYPLSIDKFDDNLDKIFNNLEVAIYQYSPKS